MGLSLAKNVNRWLNFFLKTRLADQYDTETRQRKNQANEMRLTKKSLKNFHPRQNQYETRFCMRPRVLAPLVSRLRQDQDFTEVHA